MLFVLILETDTLQYPNASKWCNKGNPEESLISHLIHCTKTHHSRAQTHERNVTFCAVPRFLHSHAGRNQRPSFTVYPTRQLIQELAELIAKMRQRYAEQAAVKLKLQCPDAHNSQYRLCHRWQKPGDVAEEGKNERGAVGPSCRQLSHVPKTVDN